MIDYYPQEITNCSLLCPKQRSQGEGAMIGLAIRLKGELDQLVCCFPWQSCAATGTICFSTTGVERRVRRPCQELPGSFDRSQNSPALHRIWMECRSGRFWSRTVPHSTPRTVPLSSADWQFRNQVTFFHFFGLRL